MTTWSLIGVVNSVVLYGVVNRYLYGVVNRYCASCGSEIIIPLLIESSDMFRMINPGVRMRGTFGVTRAKNHVVAVSSVSSCRLTAIQAVKQWITNCNSLFKWKRARRDSKEWRNSSRTSAGRSASTNRAPNSTREPSRA